MSSHPPTTTATLTSYCFRCQHCPSADDDDEPLKTCARCHVRRYCSRDCQRNDWPRHKAECAVLAAGGQPAQPRMRTTMRITGDQLARMTGRVAPPAGRGESTTDSDAEGDDDDDDDDIIDTIYYVKTSKPHLNDVALAGPFYPLEDALVHMLEKLRAHDSVAGESMLDDLVSSYEGGRRFAGFIHLNAPLPDGNIMKIELLDEHNPRVARGLPAGDDAWYVAVGEPILRDDGARRAADGHPPVRDMNVHATYTTKEEANAAARQVLQELKTDAAGDDRAVVETNSTRGLVYGFVVIPGTHWSRIVQVQHYKWPDRPVVSV